MNLRTQCTVPLPRYCISHYAHSLKMHSKGKHFQATLDRDSGLPGNPTFSTKGVHLTRKEPFRTRMVHGCFGQTNSGSKLEHSLMQHKLIGKIPNSSY